MTPPRLQFRSLHHEDGQEKLGELQQDLASRRTKALLIVRNDRIVCEWYAAGHDYYNYVLNENGKHVYYGSKPEDYLTDVIAKIANGYPNKQRDNLLPWAYAAAPALSDVA